MNNQPDKKKNFRRSTWPSFNSVLNNFSVDYFCGFAITSKLLKKKNQKLTLYLYKKPLRWEPFEIPEMDCPYMGFLYPALEKNKDLHIIKKLHKQKKESKPWNKNRCKN